MLSSRGFGKAQGPRLSDVHTCLQSSEAETRPIVSMYYVMQDIHIMFV